MAASRQQRKHGQGFGLVGWFTEYPAVQRNQGICGENRLLAVFAQDTQCRMYLGLCQALRTITGVLTRPRCLIHQHADCPELHMQLP